MSLKQPMKVFWKVKVSETDCSEKSRPEICEILFEIL